MIHKIFRDCLVLLFSLTILIAQVTQVSAADIEAASEGAKIIAEKYYINARERAKHLPELRTYSDHGENHAATVAIKSLDAADAVMLAGLGNPCYSSIDLVELKVAAFLHDTGMDGGSFKEYANGNALRKDHSLNSAIHVLENRDAIAALGVNPDMVALDCMGHSKSCSGVRDLTSHKQWTDCFNRIDDAVALYNAKYPNTPIYFDKTVWTTGETFIKDNAEIYQFDREALARSAAVIAALRIGDANREAADYPVTQGGEIIEVDFDSYVSNAKNWKSEIKRAKVFMIDEDGNKTSLLDNGVDIDGYGRMYMTGEGNLSMNCNYNPKTQALREIFTVHNGKSFPLSTQECIEERLGELDTMKNLPVEAHIQISGNYSARDKKRIARTYERYCKNATRKHQFSVTFEFK